MKWDEAVRATDVVWTLTVFAVGCRLCRLHTSENFHLHRTEESEREESREQRTTENKRILFVFLVVFTAHRRKHVKYASMSLYCGTCSDKWNRRQIVFQCFKMSEDELMPNLRVSYFCLDETVAAVSTQHRASYQRNSRLPLIVEFWFFFFLSGFISMWISGFESFVFMTLLTHAGLTTVKNTSTASLWKRWTFCSRWRPNWRYTTKSVFIQDLLTYSRAVWTALTREKIQIYVICVN